MRRAVLLSIFSIVCFCFGFCWYVWTDFVTKPAGSSQQEIVFEVLPGQSFPVVAKQLTGKGLISNYYLFSLYVRLKNAGKSIKVGEYALSQNMTPHQILETLESGKSIQRSLTVSEGLNIFEVAEIYEKFGLGSQDDFLKLCRDKDFLKTILSEDVDSCEGYLFPETYMITKYTTLKELMAQMMRKFTEVYAEVTKTHSLPGWSRQQIVTFASIVEKETGAPEERPLVSSVFHNRLNKGMLLQTDPTVLYGKALELGKMEIKISREDLHKPTKYNTYVIKGLPPGPISNPGKEALQATFKPADSKYLYFVSQNNGTHVFSETYELHSQAVKRFQLNPKAREGKSWRDLKKPKLLEQTGSVQ